MTARSDDSHTELTLADTSLFIAVGEERPLSGHPPERGDWRPSEAEALDPLPVDTQVAHAWATLRLVLRDAGKRMPINDSWIAATAIANGMPVASQDGDYDGVPGLQVIRV
jgi:hypothetical protein